ncbi:MAG: Crp/Fnr family transcriptional regulator [Oscillospiraceae bacterium]
MSNGIISQYAGYGNVSLSPACAEMCRSLGAPVRLTKNQVLYSIGDQPDSCYYVLSGSLAAFEYTASGSERVYNVNRPGELVLVPSVIASHRLFLNFKANEPTVLIRIRRDAILQAMVDEPELALQVVYNLSSHLLDTIEQSRELSGYSVQWRVCSMLLRMADRYGVGYDGKLLIEEKISQQAIANAIHANRVTVTRTIGELKDLGLVEMVNGYYCIRSVDRLKRHMSYLETNSGCCRR